MLTVRSFQNYIEKYKVAFETFCICWRAELLDGDHRLHVTCTLVRYWRAVFTLGQQLVVFLVTHRFQTYRKTQTDSYHRILAKRKLFAQRQLCCSLGVYSDDHVDACCSYGVDCLLFWSVFTG